MEQKMLTTALQTPEHAGRVRGVGGFVTPTAFFNFPKAKKTQITKAELLERNQREMAELKALVNASNDHSPMFSDKSSYQVPVNKEGATNKRNVGVAVKPLSAKQLLVNDEDFVGFDPSPPSGKKGPQSCELALDCIENKVAFGTVFDDHEEMNVSVHGVLLKPGHVHVSVDGHIQPEASVLVPIPGEIEVVRQTVGSHVAWPRELIIYPTVAKKKKEVLQGQSKRKDELQKLQDDYRKMKLNKNVPKQYKVLYKHAAVFMKATGESIPIPCDSDVFGTEKIIYILHENVKALLEFDMIGQAAISVYMACHWILVVIWDGDIYILNPLPHPTHFDELEKSLTEAMKSYNAQTGRGNKAPQIKNLLGSPKQPGGVECGYVIMRYMKDIIADKELSFTTKWAAKTRKSYTRQELDEVRMEVLEFIQDKM
ncbi:uncharacterized protein LOC141706073 [Apium graveolens]|uniref:uncharacterized protein LOC141706073 n=1 Tax=Apium graveolens TaxID=4045 RepID=UPI003D7A503A